MQIEGAEIIIYLEDSENMFTVDLSPADLKLIFKVLGLRFIASDEGNPILVSYSQEKILKRLEDPYEQNG